eukprot:1152015-Pelagomonas_calceolata.AAC.8
MQAWAERRSGGAAINRCNSTAQRLQHNLAAHYACRGMHSKVCRGVIGVCGRHKLEACRTIFAWL